MKHRILSALFLITPLAPAAPLKVADLRTEFQSAPTGIGEKPSLSWKLLSDERGAWQTHWQILAASSPDLLTEEKADLWNSKQTKGSKKHLISWGASPLKPGQKVFWKVRVWNGQNETSEWSKSAHFTTGGKTTLTKPTRISTFESSSPQLNALFTESVTKLEARLSAFSAETPDRLGPGAQVHRSARAILYHFDAIPHLTEWLRQMDQSMTKEGFFPTYPGSDTLASASSEAAIIVQHPLWWMSGNSDLVKKRWTLFEKHMIAREGLDKKLLGTQFGKTTEIEGMPAPFFDLCYLGLATRFARELARPAQQPLNVIRFDDYDARIRRSFGNQYLTPEGSLKVTSQTAHVLALRSNVLTPEQKKKIVASLLTSLDKDGLKVGPIGAYFLPSVLTLTGNQDLAIKLLTNLTDAQKDLFTGNGISEWLMAYVAGIDTAIFGFSQPFIAPRIPADDSITWVKASHQGPAGDVKASWKKLEKGALQIDITIPTGSIARLKAPATKDQIITEGGKNIKDLREIESFGRTDSDASFITQSGNYSFLIK